MIGYFIHQVIDLAVGLLAHVERRLERGSRHMPSPGGKGAGAGALIAEHLLERFPEEIKALTPDQFEEWVAARFRDLGWSVKVAGASLGARLAMRIGSRLIKPLLVVTSTGMALRLIWQVWAG